MPRRMRFSCAEFMLEDRLAPANLILTSLELTDAYNTPESNPVYGQKLYLRANWSATGMAGNEVAPIRITANGFPLDSEAIHFAAGNSTGIVYLNGWFAGTSTLPITATIDPNAAVTESTETDNAITLNVNPVAPILPSKFVQPLGRVANVDYTTGNYMDVDPRPYVSDVQPNASDARGGGFVYDYHEGSDSGAYGFNGIDAGFPVYTIADGIVTYASDGEYDRESYTNNSSAGNIIEINHGNGWTSVYYHLAANTLTVKVGDSVKQGQVIALLGASGYSNGGQHLHFAPLYRGAVVETLFAPSSYWQNPLPYSGDVAPFVYDMFITNQVPNYNDITYEQSPRINTFSSNDPSTLYFTALTFNVKTPAHTTVMSWKFYKPDGSLWNTFPITYQAAYNSRNDYWYYYNTVQNFLNDGGAGTWQFAFLFDGVEMKRIPFTITAAGDADMRVSFNNPVTGLNDQIINDERTTPIEFGSVAQSAVAPTQTMTIANRGSVPLLLSGYTLPTGFSFVGSPPASIPANSTANLVVQMNTTTVGPQFGRIRFLTNDPDVAEMNFNLAGTVTGTPLAGAPVITLNDKALAFNFKSLARVFAPTATVTDSDSANFNGGSLRVELASGGNSFDALGIRNQGTASGQIATGGLSAQFVYYGGVIIGTYLGGTVTSPLVITFNSAAATPAAVQALIRNLTYNNTKTTPDYARRYLRLTLTDAASGKVSNLAIVNITPSGVERSPTIATLSTAATTPGYAFSKTGSFSDPYGNTWTGTVNYGDGNGPQPLTLNTDKTFSLTKAYAAVGAYPVTVTVTSDTGGTRSGSFTVNVYTAPTVTGITINDGAMQRSRLTKITVNLGSSIDAAVFANAGAVTLARTSPGGGPTVDATNGLIISPTTGTTNTLTLTFANVSTAGIDQGSLTDGRWQLSIPVLGYTSPLNSPNLRRLFGDANGDGTIDGNDLIAFGNAFGSSNPLFDFNSNGTVDGSDLLLFGNRFGLSN